MNAIDVIKQLPAAFDATAAAGTNCVIQFNTSAPSYLTVKDGSCAFSDGTAPDADVTLTMQDEDLIALMKGELNGMTAFMTGKLQVDGDLMLAQKVTTMFDASKLKS